MVCVDGYEREGYAEVDVNEGEVVFVLGYVYEFAVVCREIEKSDLLLHPLRDRVVVDTTMLKTL
jgi:hypothetical protein